mmetsp:Transcript_112897/g.282651  ORF Transcript_112897/g.282651 Transcript_112897/m.282651 type:complete len:314 (+) Transcript_112897:142-1083(+)
MLNKSQGCPALTPRSEYLQVIHGSCPMTSALPPPMASTAAVSFLACLGNNTEKGLDVEGSQSHLQSSSRTSCLQGSSKCWNATLTWRVLLCTVPFAPTRGFWSLNHLPSEPFVIAPTSTCGVAGGARGIPWNGVALVQRCQSHARNQVAEDVLLPRQEVADDARGQSVWGRVHDYVELHGCLTLSGLVEGDCDGVIATQQIAPDTMAGNLHIHNDIQPVLLAHSRPKHLPTVWKHLHYSFHFAGITPKEEGSKVVSHLFESCWCHARREQVLQSRVKDLLHETINELRCCIEETVVGRDCVNVAVPSERECND